MSHVDVELYNNQKEIVSMSLNSIECPVSIDVTRRYSCSKGNGKKLNLTKRLKRILTLRLLDLIFNSILPIVC